MTMRRLHFSILCTAAFLAVGLVAYLARANAYQSHKLSGSATAVHAQHQDTNALGTTQANLTILGNATVSFGSWMTTPVLDRFPNLSPIAANHHEIIPQLALIRAGGTVNFVIAGFHHVLVYDDDTKPSDINTNMTVPPTNQPMPMLIADPNRRIYRGLDPSTQSQDRVEVVQFAKPGTYLVICGVLPHFQQGMYGYVKVIR